MTDTRRSIINFKTKITDVYSLDILITAQAETRLVPVSAPYHGQDQKPWLFWSSPKNQDPEIVN